MEDKRTWWQKHGALVVLLLAFIMIPAGVLLDFCVRIQKRSMAVELTQEEFSDELLNRNVPFPYPVGDFFGQKVPDIHLTYLGFFTIMKAQFDDFVSWNDEKLQRSEKVSSINTYDLYWLRKAYPTLSEIEAYHFSEMITFAGPGWFLRLMWKDDNGKIRCCYLLYDL